MRSNGVTAREGGGNWGGRGGFRVCNPPRGEPQNRGGLRGPDGKGSTARLEDAKPPAERAGVSAAPGKNCGAGGGDRGQHLAGPSRAMPAALRPPPPSAARPRAPSPLLSPRLGCEQPSIRESLKPPRPLLARFGCFLAFLRGIPGREVLGGWIEDRRCRSRAEVKTPR